MEIRDAFTPFILAPRARVFATQVKEFNRYTIPTAGGLDEPASNRRPWHLPPGQPRNASCCRSPGEVTPRVLVATARPPREYVSGALPWEKRATSGLRPPPDRHLRSPCSSPNGQSSSPAAPSTWRRRSGRQQNAFGNGEIYARITGFGLLGDPASPWTQEKPTVIRPIMVALLMRMEGGRGSTVPVVKRIRSAGSKCTASLCAQWAARHHRRTRLIVYGRTSNLALQATVFTETAAEGSYSCVR